MKLVDFSVTNYRSITAAHKLVLQDMTVLVGKNNEGKSNLLRALNVAMVAVILHSRTDVPRTYILASTIGIMTFPSNFKIGKVERNLFLG